MESTGTVEVVDGGAAGAGVESDVVLAVASPTEAGSPTAAPAAPSRRARALTAAEDAAIMLYPEVPIPQGWWVQESTRRPGVAFFTHPKLRLTQWEDPREMPLDSEELAAAVRYWDAVHGSDIKTASAAAWTAAWGVDDAARGLERWLQVTLMRAARVGPLSRVLDLGCGDGQALSRASTRLGLLAANGVGVDASLAATQSAAVTHSGFAWARADLAAPATPLLAAQALANNRARLWGDADAAAQPVRRPTLAGGGPFTHVFCFDAAQHAFRDGAAARQFARNLAACLDAAVGVAVILAPLEEELLRQASRHLLGWPALTAREDEAARLAVGETPAALSLRERAAAAEVCGQPLPYQDVSPPSKRLAAHATLPRDAASGGTGENSTLARDAAARAAARERVENYARARGAQVRPLANLSSPLFTVEWASWDSYVRRPSGAAWGGVEPVVNEEVWRAALEEAGLVEVRREDAGAMMRRARAAHVSHPRERDWIQEGLQRLPPPDVVVLEGLSPEMAATPLGLRDEPWHWLQLCCVRVVQRRGADPAAAPPPLDAARPLDAAPPVDKANPRAWSGGVRGYSPTAAMESESPVLVASGMPPPASIVIQPHPELARQPPPSRASTDLPPPSLASALRRQPRKVERRRGWPRGWGAGGGAGATGPHRLASPLVPSGHRSPTGRRSPLVQTDRHLSTNEAVSATAATGDSETAAVAASCPPTQPRLHSALAAPPAEPSVRPGAAGPPWAAGDGALHAAVAAGTSTAAVELATAMAARWTVRARLQQRAASLLREEAQAEVEAKAQAEVRGEGETAPSPGPPIPLPRPRCSRPVVTGPRVPLHAAAPAALAAPPPGRASGAGR